MARFSRPPLASLLPTGGGIVAGLSVAAVVALLPGWRLEQWVEASGLPLLLAMARPPLGDTARLMLAAGAGGVAGAVAWSALFLLVGPGGVLAPRPREQDAPVVRRADAHPDAPPRWPLSAAELGTPPAPPQERDLPADLETPLAAFDPAAIPAVSREPVRAVPSVAVAPVVRTPPRPEGKPSIETLLERLERGTRRPMTRAMTS